MASNKTTVELYPLPDFKKSYSIDNKIAIASGLLNDIKASHVKNDMYITGTLKKKFGNFDKDESVTIYFTPADNMFIYNKSFSETYKCGMSFELQEASYEDGDDFDDSDD